VKDLHVLEDVFNQVPRLVAVLLHQLTYRLSKPIFASPTCIVGSELQRQRRATTCLPWPQILASHRNEPNLGRKTELLTAGSGHQIICLHKLEKCCAVLCNSNVFLS